MFGLGAQELFIILLIVIVLFGASKISGLGSALGGSIRDFRRAVRDDHATPETIEAAAIAGGKEPARSNS